MFKILVEHNQFACLCKGSTREMSCSCAFAIVVLNVVTSHLTKTVLQLAVGHSVELIVFYLLDVSIPG